MHSEAGIWLNTIKIQSRGCYDCSDHMHQMTKHERKRTTLAKRIALSQHWISTEWSLIFDWKSERLSTSVICSCSSESRNEKMAWDTLVTLGLFTGIWDTNPRFSSRTLFFFFFYFNGFTLAKQEPGVQILVFGFIRLGCMLMHGLGENT